MDIHRCRFVPYPASTINVLAFSHSHANREKKAVDLRLAVGRANGDIEIWNPLNGSWLQETILRGGKDRSVDGLVWVQDPDEDGHAGKRIVGRLRLFSIGYSTSVTEWDLEKGQPLRESSGNHGEIWCLAAQPPGVPASNQSNGSSVNGAWHGQSLITGCTDGAVVLYSTSDQDLKLQRVLVRPSAKKAKVISIVFQGRNNVVAGCTDGTIRIYDIRSGILSRSMSLGVGPIGGPKEIIVWSVRCLPNGNILSGDSTGELRIWDGKTFTLMQRIKSHRQDILSLVTSADGTMIFSGGMDRRTVVYKQVGGSRSRWAEVTHRRFHSHDVKTMATFEGKGISIVVSGGPDACPVIIPLREFGLENQRTLPYLPQEPIVQSAPEKRLLLSWWDREVNIWRISKTSSSTREIYDSDSEAAERGTNRKLVAKIVVKGEANISSASISPDGSLLAVSTPGEIKIFRLKSRTIENTDSLRVTKIETPSKLSVGGARSLLFSPDGHWLAVVRRDSRIVIARVLDHNTDSVRLLSTLSKIERLDRKIEKHLLLGGLGAYDRTITRMAFSSDSRILAVADLAGYIDTWVLEGLEDFTPAGHHLPILEDASLFSSSDSSDSDCDQDEREERRPTVILGQCWIRNPSAALIPKLPSPAAVLAFRSTIVTEPISQSITVPTAHPTRHNPHPHLQDLPRGDDRLLVVSALGPILEFSALQGTLSAWSRQNPRAKFPKEFIYLRDQAMGCVWDLENSQDRLWLYGSNWMWMFDLSRNLPSEASLQERSLTNGFTSGGTIGPDRSRPIKKRKIDHVDTSMTNELRKGTSGAGSRVPDSELVTGVSRKYQKVAHEKDNVKTTLFDYRSGAANVDTDEFDGDIDADGMDLVLRRTGHTDDAAYSNGDRQVATSNGDGDGNADISSHWWYTYKYRPIMGIVPISGDAGLEVVLVERPMWEMDLPPRYYGDQEWEKPGI